MFIFFNNYLDKSQLLFWRHLMNNLVEINPLKRIQSTIPSMCIIYLFIYLFIYFYFQLIHFELEFLFKVHTNILFSIHIHKSNRSINRKYMGTNFYIYRSKL